MTLPSYGNCLEAHHLAWQLMKSSPTKLSVPYRTHIVFSVVEHWHHRSWPNQSGTAESLIELSATAASSTESKHGSFGDTFLPSLHKLVELSWDTVFGKRPKHRCS